MKPLLSSFFLFSFALAGHALAGPGDLPYKDTDFACISQADADKYARDFGIDVASFGGMELCNPAKDTKKLFNDISLIEKTQFAADNGHSFIRGFVPASDYYGWMKGETRGMDRGNDIPWATAYNSGGYFTMQDGWAALSTLGRVGTVIHEARHTAGYRHYASHGPYGGSSSAGCDTTYSQGGSHGVEMEYYARVVLTSRNLHPAYKSMARLMALGRSNFVFNETPMRQREALLGLSGERLVLVDGVKTFERERPAAAAGSALKRTSFGASLVRGQKAVAVDVYGFSNNGYAMEDDYSYYKLYKTPRPGGPSQIQSIEEIDVGTKRYFAVLAAVYVWLVIAFFDGHPVYQLEVHEAPKGRLKEAALAYRAAFEALGVKLISENKSFGKNRLDYVLRAPRGSAQADFQAGITEKVPPDLRGELDWEVR